MDHYDDAHFRGHLNKHDLDSREEARRRAAVARSESRARQEGAYTSGYRSPTSHYTSRRKREQYSAREEFDRLNKEARAAAAARPHSRRDQYERDEMAFRDHDPHARARLKAPLYEHLDDEGTRGRAGQRAREDRLGSGRTRRAATPDERSAARDRSRGSSRPSSSRARRAPHNADRGSLEQRAASRSRSSERRQTGGFSASRDQIDMSPLGRHRNAGTRRGGFGMAVDARIIPLGIALVVAIALLVTIASCVSSRVADAQTVTLTVNGAQREVGGSQDIAALLASGVQTMPGDLLAVDGSVLEQGAGYPATVEVDGTIQTDYATKLADGADVRLSRGGDIMEPSRQEERSRAIVGEVRGNGPVHVRTQEGRAGKERVTVGETSGAVVVDEVIDEGEPAVYEGLYVNTDGEKVIALTFDDGPLADYTPQVLDILKENDAKATFFTIGTNVERAGASDIVKRTADEGHQVCTHSYDHAAGSGQGVNMAYMTAEEQVAEVQRGQDALRAVIGDSTSTVFRAPGGNFPAEVWGNVAGLISAEIGWNVDTSDWESGSADAVASTIMAAKPGDIVLMHDGGGNRTATVEGLRKALPELKKQGYRFVTVDELMEYRLEAR